MFVEASTSIVNLSPCFALKSCYKHRFSRVSVRCTRTAADSSLVESVDSVKVNGVSLNKRVGSLNDEERGELLGSNVIDDKSRWKEEKLEPLWDDGYGTQTVKDYLDLANDIIKPDGGPPRWFCPVVADGNDNPLANSPFFLFLSGMDALGLGLILHHKSLRKVFEVRCLHIPVQDRTPHSNGSQFFITLDRCDWLDKKHTIFGKVLWNPFDDVFPRSAPAKSSPSTTTEAGNKDTIKKKATKKLNLLSFGEEAQEEEKELAAVKIKIRSNHDVLNDPRLSKEENASDPSEDKARRDLQMSVREALSSKKEELPKESDADSDDNDDDEASFDVRMCQQILKKKKELGDVSSKQKEHKGNLNPEVKSGVVSF